jgi:hypothetical protein
MHDPRYSVGLARLEQLERRVVAEQQAQQEANPVVGPRARKQLLRLDL